MKKFLPYILILIVLVGLFGPAGKVEAAGACFNPDGQRITIVNVQTKEDCLKTNNATRQKNYDECAAAVPFESSVGKFPNIQACAKYFSVNYWVEGVPPTPINPNPGTIPCTGTDASGAPTPAGCTPGTPTSNSVFKNKIDDKVCGVGFVNGGSLEGCILKFFYVVFYQLPGGLLWLCAYFFNVLISVSLSSTLFTHPFVSEAWAIVRDISNIFFILILIYIAIKIILGLGGHDVKEMIGRVIIVALLINFSMFFTGIIIDTSNILAQIFYNKLNVNTRVNGEPTDYDSVNGEKDVAGGMVSAFDPTSRLDDKFFEQARTAVVNGQPHVSDEVPTGMMVLFILIAGLVMGFAAYALFVSGLSFVGRLIELWVLIIFSPFAFMSSSVPFLSGIENLGWKSWFSRLLKVAFMAPVFMFFLYFIFLLIHSEIYKTIIAPSTTEPSGQGSGAVSVAKTLLGVLLPTCLILFLLLQASKIAKKGSGMLGDAITKVGQTVGGLTTGLVLGAATGGTAMALRGTIGRGAANLAESNWVRDRAAQGKFGGTSLLKAGSYLGTKSFDARNAPGAETLAKKAGANLGAAKAIGLGPQKGFAENRAAAVKKKEEFAKKLLDTSDYGKAELSRGGMSVEKATKLRRQMRDQNMSAADQLKYYNAMIGNGIQPQDLAQVASYLDAGRRNAYADRLEDREKKWSSGARDTNAKNRISANKIRKGAQALQGERSVAHALGEIAHKIHESEEKPKEAPHGPATPNTLAPAASPASPQPPVGGGTPAH